MTRPGVFALRLMDRDLERDDPIGTWQAVIGELVESPGVKHVILVDESGALMGAGVLALKITVAQQ